MDGTHSPSKRTDVERVEREPVTSSNIRSLGYAPEDSTLAVEFKGGGIFHYKNVPADVAVQLLGVTSVGQAYAALIKGKFSAERMTGSCPDCGDGPGIVGETCDSCGCDVYEVDCGEPHPVAAGVTCRAPRRHGDAHAEKKRGGAVWTNTRERDGAHG